MKQVFEYYDRVGQAGTDAYRYCPFCQAALQFVELGDLVRPQCLGCGFVHYQNPAPAISIMIVDHNKILLGKRKGDPGKGAWAIPSGYIEFGQDFITTAICEAKEETGLDVEVLSVLNVVSTFYSPRYHFFSVYVKAQMIAGVLQAGDDLSEVQWFYLDQELPALAFEEDREMIAVYQSGGYREIPVDKRFARRIEG